MTWNAGMAIQAMQNRRIAAYQAKHQALSTELKELKQAVAAWESICNCCGPISNYIEDSDGNP